MVIDGGINALKRTRYFYTEFYDIEVYSGQLPLAEIHRRLPGRWRIVERYPTDVLFENLEPWVYVPDDKRPVGRLCVAHRARGAPKLVRPADLPGKSVS